MANKVIQFGDTQLIDTGTLFEIEHDGTTRFIVNSSTGDVTLGSSDSTAKSDLMAVGISANTITCSTLRASTQISLDTTGAQLLIAEGGDSIMGSDTVTQLLGEKTIYTGAVKSNSRIFLTSTNNPGGGNPWSLYIDSIDGGTSFVVKAVNITSDANFNWLIISPPD